MLCTLGGYVVKVVNVDDYVRVLFNTTSVSKGKDVASDDGNIVSDKEKCVDVDDECVVEVKEADSLELIGKRVSSIDVTFEVYNEYAFHKGFSIRCDKLRRREG